MEVVVYLNARCKEILELLMTAGTYILSLETPPYQ